MNFKDLNNIKINSIKSNSDKIIIESNNKTFILSAEGDCCSSSWIEHIELPKPGEIIKSLEKIDITKCEDDYIDEQGEHHECLEFYFYRLITDKGSYDIEMRNSSNGYYGGWLELNIKNNK